MRVRAVNGFAPAGISPEVFMVLVVPLVVPVTTAPPAPVMFQVETVTEDGTRSLMVAFVIFPAPALVITMV
ncbi:hypothetical protein D3C71_1753830 [compost metagenome]